MRASYRPFCWIALAGLTCAGQAKDTNAVWKKAGADEGLRQAFERVVYRLEGSGPGRYQGVNPVLRLTGAHAQCTVVMNVTGTTAGMKNNVSGNVSSNQGGTGNAASASINVLAVTAPTVLYDNLGSGSNVYNGGTPFALINSATGGWPGAGLLEHAYAFTPAITAGFRELDIAVGLVTGNGSLTVDLMSDSSGPGSILQSWTLTDTLPRSNSCCILQKLSGNGAIPLVAGTTYWVAVLPGANTWAWWDENTTGATALHALNQGGGWGAPGSGVAGAFEVQGTTGRLTGTAFNDFAGNGLSGSLLYDPSLGQSYTALSNGNGIYSYVPNLFSPGFNTLRTGDFNGDGKADLILYSSQTGAAYIGFGKGDGTFNFQSLFWSPGFDTVVTGDISGDGKTDVALYNSTTGTLYTGISNGDGTFTYEYHLVSQNYTFVRLADFSGSGKANLFVYRASDGLASLGIGDGTGAFAFNPLSISAGYNLADTGDLNGDGKADIILYNGTNGNAATGISDGSGGFTFTALIFSPGFTSVRLGNYTGHSTADAIIYNKNTAIAYFGTGTGTGSFNFQSLFWSPGYDYVIPEDVNGDGKTDIVLSDSATGTEYTGLSNGDGTFNYIYSYWGIGKLLAQSAGTVPPQSTTYTYHGNDYTACGGTYCTGGPYALSVTFDTTLTGGALENLPYTNIASTITSFRFSDGSGLALVSNIQDLYISTDASGNIITWLIGACGTTCNTQMQTNWDSPFGFIPGADFSETSVNFSGNYGFVPNKPGKWVGIPAFSASQESIKFRAKPENQTGAKGSGIQ